MIHIRQFPCLKDNYGFLVHDDASGETAAIDTPDADAYLAEAKAAGWRITQIWNTHWHPDHAGGNAAIKTMTGAVVIGPGEVERIGQAPDLVVVEGDGVSLGTHKARVLDVGGHTLGHIAFVFDAEKIAFVGDALFAMGCGRLFEGTPAQMWSSLSKLARLPAETRVYCGHEYTQSNGRFALSLEPENPDLVARMKEVNDLREKGLPTIPSTIGIELKTNPFLRPSSAALRKSLALESADVVEVFAETRRRKDTF